MKSLGFFWWDFFFQFGWGFFWRGEVCLVSVFYLIRIVVLLLSGGGFHEKL